MDENLLRALFDFQRFAGNERLDALIRAAELPGDTMELSDDELDLNAAGEPDVWRLPGKDGEPL